jgi:hypothetical protein
VSFFRLRRSCVLALLVLLFVAPGRSQAQSRLVNPPTPFAPRHTWSVFGEYSPSSSHIILGEAREREFVTLGLAYTHNMHRARHWDLNYLLEVRPLMLESDPATTGNSVYIDWPGLPVIRRTTHYVHKRPVLEMHPSVSDRTFYIDGLPFITDFTTYYARRWTWAGGLSPLGLKLNLLRHSRVQPTLEANGGIAASLRDIPMFHTSAMNFTFSFGAGFEIFQRNGRALRLQYRIQHFSNAGLGSDPGIDSQMIYAGYAWGH